MSSSASYLQRVYNRFMRRLLSIAAFVLVGAVLSASAQRGGMRASGGSHGGFSGHSGFVGHGSGGPHIGGTGFGGSHLSSGLGSHFGPVPRSFGRGDHFRGGRLHDRGFRRGCFGCFGYPYYSYYDPYWWYDSYSSYDMDYERERQEANEMNAENLEEQRMRQEEQDAYALPRHSRMNSPASDPQPREERASASPATALVFRDQHVEEVRNYAIAGGTLWVLNEQAAKKIPLAQLDIPATVKMNDEHGVDFQVPGYSLSLSIVR
jgi:hypothetical protein